MILSLMHFLVDAVCVCCLFLAAPILTPQSLLWAFMTYNVMAFLTQPLTGHLADRNDNSRWILYTAVALLCVGAVITGLACLDGWGVLPLVAAVVLGAGNSLFHVWGGKATATGSGNDIRQLGVFVAPGALGLAVGVCFASWGLLMGLIVVLVGLAGYGTTRIKGTTETPGTTKLLRGWVMGGMALIIAVVMGRSLVSETFTSSYKQIAALGGEEMQTLTLIVGLTAMLGKMAGGWLSHYMGLASAVAVMILVVVVCLLWPAGNAGMMLTGLFAVNCNMPVTLYLANLLMPGREGLAFGLLAAALMPGYILATVNYGL